ncbi:UPF0489 family protein [Pseudomonas aeruginosa]|uniref:UPF0489 family protein n=1 Tax=Pseudomonas aeruginosa TaxID=287 RepID=UPI00124624A9|nr:UPF0489 family protein [Pseudomonas aeruginosa]KAB0773157.1 hypothetical protein F7P00_22450 [Pseudomonas aeruginosa]
MQLTTLFKHHAIKGKDIYVVDDHHKALAAWVLVRRSLNGPPNLITIDHHTDTYEAFLGHAHWEAYEGRVADQEAFRVGLVARIDWRSDASVAEAIGNLRHDEHIDAATCSGALGDAFCIQLSDSGGTPSVEQLAFEKSMAESWPHPPAVPKPQRPLTYEPAANSIYVLPFDCFIGCQTRPHNDDCFMRQADEIIESSYLDDQIARGSEISRCIGLSTIEAAPYILDIDLDIFHTRQAINPEDPSTFYRLIKNAVAITIATEAGCVEEEWLDDGDKMDSGELLQELLGHISKAL